MKKTVTLALKIGVSLLLYAYIFRKVNVGQLWTTIRTCSPSWVILAIVIYFIVQILSAYRWYTLLRPLQIEVPFIKIFGFYLIGMYSSLFLPATIGGDVVKVYYLNKEARTLSGATATVFLDRDFGLAALLLIAIVAAAVAGTQFKGVPLTPIFACIMAGYCAANLALFFRPTYSLLHRLLKLLRLKRSDEKVERLFQSVNAYRGQWGVILTVMLVSFAVQFGGVLVNLAGGIGLGMHPQHGIVDYLVFIPAISLIGMNPVSINGMGWREAAYVILFKSVGVREDQAIALAIIWLTVLVVTSLPGGLVYIMMQGPNKKKLSDAETNSSPSNVELLQPSVSADLSPDARP